MLHFLRQHQNPSLSCDSSPIYSLHTLCHTAIELAGPYVWNDVYDLLVLPPSFPYGGMEVGLAPATQTEGYVFNALPRRTRMYMVGSCGIVAAPAGLQRQSSPVARPAKARSSQSEDLTVDRPHAKTGKATAKPGLLKPREM